MSKLGSARDFRVLVLKDGDLFVAQCLEVDLAAQGNTQDEAMHRLRSALCAELAEAGFDRIGPAPELFHTIYNSGFVGREHLAA